MDHQTDETVLLRAGIGIITRGGPVKVNVLQRSNPVLLQGMALPAEASYIFSDPRGGHTYRNLSPVSIELFFGENQHEGDDTSLGRYALQDFLPPLAAARDIEIRLAVNAAQILSIALLNPTTQQYRTIGFVDISDLEPPEVRSEPHRSAAHLGKHLLQQWTELFTDPRPRETPRPQRGRDLSQELTISFEEALRGATKDIEAVSTEMCHLCAGSGAQSGASPVHCAECEGTGWKKEALQTDQGRAWRGKTCPACGGDGFVTPEPCRNCQGNGWVKTTHLITLQIPALIDSGARICILHQGEPGRHGGVPGHLLIQVSIADHPLLTRTGHTISIPVPVSASHARSGGLLRVPGVEDATSFVVDLPARTKRGTVLRVGETDDCTLVARVETYRPGLLFLLPSVRSGLQAIRALLGNADYELSIPPEGLTASQPPTAKEYRPKEQPQPATTQPPRESTPTPGHDENPAEFYTRRGMIYAESGNQTRALADYNRALGMDPDHANAYDRRSILYLAQDDPVKALADLNRALELDPHNAEYHFHRGLYFQIQNDATKALADFSRALELDPANAVFYESRGRLAALRDDLEGAIADYSKALELDPDNPKIYHSRGVLYQHKNALAKTIADFGKALELNPDSRSVLRDRAQVYISLGDLDNALSDTVTLVEKSPYDARAYSSRGYVHLLRHSLEEALNDYSRALELDPELVPACTYRGKTYLELNRFEDAREDLTKALLLQPENTYVYLWLGQAQQGLGEEDKAIELFQKVLDVCEDDELCLQARGLLADMGIE
jgi:tetratricopeptide (TPR) repeat protein